MQLSILPVFLLLFHGHTAHADPEKKIAIQLCTDDSAKFFTEFAHAVNTQLTFCRVLEESDCAITPLLFEGETLIIGRFSSGDDGEIFLKLELANGDLQRLREMPWLDNKNLPLQMTVQRKRVASFAILVDNLVLEFQQLRLEPVSPIQVEESAETPPEKIPARETDEPPARDTSVIPSHRIRVFSGMHYLNPTLIAPHVGLGYSIYLHRFGIFVQLAYEFDSSYELEGRDFETSSVFGRLGAEYIVFVREKGHIGVGIELPIRYNMFRRGDIENAATKRWFNFGVGAFAEGRIAMVGSFGACLKTGVEVFPGASELEIKNGPVEKIGLVGVFLEGGFDIHF